MEYKLHHSLNSQVQRSILEETMAELARSQGDLIMAQAEFSRSMAEIDYFQVGLPSFFYQNEKSQPPHEIMTKLEATTTELERVLAELATSQVQLLEETKFNAQILHIPPKSLEEEMTLMVTSCTQSTIEREPPLKEK